MNNQRLFPQIDRQETEHVHLHQGPRRDPLRQGRGDAAGGHRQAVDRRSGVEGADPRLDRQPQRGDGPHRRRGQGPHPVHPLLPGEDRRPHPRRRPDQPDDRRRVVHRCQEVRHLLARLGDLAHF